MFELGSREYIKFVRQKREAQDKVERAKELYVHFGVP